MYYGGGKYRCPEPSIRPLKLELQVVLLEDELFMLLDSSPLVFGEQCAYSLDFLLVFSF